MWADYSQYEAPISGGDAYFSTVYEQPPKEAAAPSSAFKWVGIAVAVLVFIIVFVVFVWIIFCKREKSPRRRSRGPPGCPFAINFVGVVTDDFFSTRDDSSDCSEEEKPWECKCREGCTWIGVVTEDQRIDKSVPEELKGNITNHMIQYDCGKCKFVDVGTFLTVPGPTGPTGPAPFEDISFSASAPQSLTGGVVTNWTESYDTHGAFNPATGEFTVPEDGTYVVTGQLTVTATSVALLSTLKLRLLVNGNTTAESAEMVPVNATNSTEQSLVTSFALPLTAGQVVTLVAIGLGVTFSVNISAPTSSFFYAFRRA